MPSVYETPQYSFKMIIADIYKKKKGGEKNTSK